MIFVSLKVFQVIPRHLYGTLYEFKAPQGPVFEAWIVLLGHFTGMLGISRCAEAPLRFD